MISVIIATYGEQSWAELAQERALPSVREQAEEVIVGHDPKATIAQVRNALAAKARGEHLCFVDADDELAPGYIEAMDHALRRRQHLGKPLLLTPAVRMIKRGRSSPPKFYREVNLLGSNWLVIGTVLERKLFRRAGGFSDYPHGFEDWSLWYKCTRLGAQVVKVRSAICVQYINPDSAHRTGWRDRDQQVKTHKRVQAELEAWVP